MRPDRPRQRWVPRWQFVLALLLALSGLVIRYVVFNTPVSAAGGRALSGVTGQATRFELGVVKGRVRWLRTSLTARCGGRTSFQETWSPTDGIEVHVEMAGRSFSTVERAHPTYSDGVIGRVAFAIHGSITGAGSAQGTIRLVGRFYKGEREWNACDSFDVPWAVGPRAAARLADVALGRQTGEYYPAVPSLALDVSPQRKMFIAQVDSVCTGTYNAWSQAQERADQVYRHSHDEASLSFAYYVRWHAWQLRSLLTLGQPPQARELYDAWLANFRQRVSIERDSLVFYKRHQWTAISRMTRLLSSLKAHGNLLGQRFGLVRCTSNGDRTPVPILGDGQPLPLT